jgi:hypothetical protein
MLAARHLESPLQRVADLVGHHLGLERGHEGIVCRVDVE